MRRRALDVGKVLLGLASSIGLGWLAVRGLEWERVLDSLSGVSMSLVLLSLAIFLFASYLRAYRWQILFVRERVSTWRLFIVQNEGIGLNNLTPVRVASEATQLAVLTLRDGMNGAVALATLGMERVIDVVASTFILGLAFFFVPEMENFTLYVWGAVGFSVVAIVVVRLTVWGSERFAFLRRYAFLRQFGDAIRALERQPLRVALSLLVSIGYWLLVGLTTWAIAVGIGLPISPVTATLVIMGTIFVATALPAAPSAVGTFEFAVVYVLGFFGIEHEEALSFALITHAVLFLPPTVVAVLFLPREGIVSIRHLGRLYPRGAGHG